MGLRVLGMCAEELDMLIGLMRGAWEVLDERELHSERVVGSVLDYLQELLEDQKGTPVGEVITKLEERWQTAWDDETWDDETPEDGVYGDEVDRAISELFHEDAYDLYVLSSLQGRGVVANDALSQGAQIISTRLRQLLDAEDPTTPASTLDELADHVDSRVVREVAGNPNTASATLYRLVAGDAREAVRIRGDLDAHPHVQLAVQLQEMHPEMADNPAKMCQAVETVLGPPPVL